MENINVPRKIVLILGNGFDLELGLKTSYKDFWESDYCPKNYPAPLIRHLNQFKKGRRGEVKWYDLENELGSYSSTKDSDKHRRDVISLSEREVLKIALTPEAPFYLSADDSNVRSLLYKGYLKIDHSRFPSIEVPYGNEVLESPLWRDRTALRRIKNCLCNYLRSLSIDSSGINTAAFHVLRSMLDLSARGEIVDIFSFNYTMLDRVMPIEDTSIISYMHGNCRDGNIIIGTGDEGDIDEEYDFLRKSFDPDYCPPMLVPKLLGADHVIIFGHSLGENDRQYFKAFFKKQTDYTQYNPKRITVFTKNQASEREIKRTLEKITDNNLSALYCMNTFKIIKTDEIKDRPDVLREFMREYGNGSRNSREIINSIASSSRYSE